ncbi:hypothetical protein AB0M36_19725 [Actinoplanes sp. NPDC051346]|uniref:hypothetical protein n=1 Tax=Actinoplanes sp. NPDC051346 TaxID=3155048 RepID=UPI00342F5C5F
MNTTTDVILVGTLAAAWLAAGLLVETLPGAHTARELRRRARALSIVVGAGVVALLAVPLVTGLLPGESMAPAAALLAAVPAMIVVTVTARRLAQLRRGVNAFATAPMAPAPLALLAAAAHPLVAAPLQATGLAAAIGVASVAGIVEVSRTDVSGVALTAAAVIVTVIALAARHAARHSRLSLAVLAPLSRGGLRARPEAQPQLEAAVPLPAPAIREADMIG